MPPGTAGPPGQPLSTSSGSGLARVRDNQRRSRARRKEYLQELESKLRKCEALGVQATVDIQLAARGVSEENARLREENGKLKEENERLRQMLSESEEGGIFMANSRVMDGSPKSCQMHDANGIRAADIEAGPALQAPASSFIGNKHYQGNVVADSNVLSHTSKQQLDISGSSDTSPASPDHTMSHLAMTPNPATSHAYIIPAQSGTLDQASCNQPNDDLPLGDDTSSCEYAAHIITSMRADVSTDDVRADLGCVSDVKEWRKCKVDNSKLFTAVDRYAG